MMKGVTENWLPLFACSWTYRQKCNTDYIIHPLEVVVTMTTEMCVLPLKAVLTTIMYFAQGCSNHGNGGLQKRKSKEVPQREAYMKIEKSPQGKRSKCLESLWNRLFNFPHTYTSPAPGENSTAHRTWFVWAHAEKGWYTNAKIIQNPPSQNT